MQIEHVNYPQQLGFYDYEIITAHGGEIKVQTKEGEGNTFVIQLAV